MSELANNLKGILPRWPSCEKLARSVEFNVVVFVGYSFPPTDVEMAYFLASSLSKNDFIQKIVVCDIRADDIVKRLKENSNYGSHFKHLLVPKNGKWQDIHDILELISQSIDYTRI